MRIEWWLLLLCFPFLITINSVAQDTQRPTESLYVEVLGNSARYSLNFDVVFPSGLGFRFGVLTASETKQDQQGQFYTEQTGFTFLMMLNLMHGQGPHHLETGVGIVAGTWRHPGTAPPLESPAWTATLGYRYQRPAKGIVVRVGFTPALTGKEIEPMVGASIGYAFGALFR
jgi:hypothetical protein